MFQEFGEKVKCVKRDLWVGNACSLQINILAVVEFCMTSTKNYFKISKTDGSTLKHSME